MKLKPCMCGGKAIGPDWHQDAIPLNQRDQRYGIRCTQCGIRLLGETKESVTEAWNSRPGETAARVEGMKEARGKIKIQVDKAPGEHIQDKRYRTGLHDGVMIIDNLIKEAENAD